MIPLRVSSTQWSSIARRGRFTFEAKAKIGNKEYLAISAPRIERCLMSAPLSVGNCNAACLNLSILTDDKLPAAQPITILGRLTHGGVATEWKAFGTYYIDQRDSFNGLVTVNCYDAMLKANTQYLSGTEPASDWPKSMRAVVSEIALRICSGIIDQRTVLNSGDDYMVPYPEGLTMAQVLGYIGACHGGNWVITEDNALRLIPLTTAPDETFHIIDSDYNCIVSDSSDDPVYLAYEDQPSFNRVLPAGQFGLVNVPVVCGDISVGDRMMVTGVMISNENGESYTDGDSSGFVLRIDSNPYATQGICDDLYAAFNRLVYLPFTAVKTVYDPVAELGDQVKIGNLVHSVIANTVLVLDHSFRADLSAPYSEELQHEYPYDSEIRRLRKSARALNSTVQDTAGRLADKAGEPELKAEIERAQTAESDLLERITALEGSVNTIEAKMQNFDSKFAEIDTALSGIVSRLDALEQLIANQE